MFSRYFGYLFEKNQRDVPVPGDAVVIGTVPSVAKVINIFKLAGQDISHSGYPECL